MSFRRMLPFIFVNILISAVVVLAILYWWDTRQAEPAAGADTAVVAPTGVSPDDEAPAVVTSIPSATPATGDETPVHVVQAGDTLGNISAFYDVPIEDIMAANGLTNPNLLTVGQELVIPVGGLPTATPPPTATAVPDVLPSPNPTEPIPEEGEAQVEISDVIGAGELTEEAVQIVNNGARQIALLNWRLSDEDQHTYVFGQVTLFGEGAGILLHTEAGQNGSGDLYWGLEEPIWESGEQVTLIDADDTVQATFIVP